MLDLIRLSHLLGLVSVWMSAEGMALATGPVDMQRDQRLLMARETRQEAATHAKRLVHDHPTGVISTVFHPGSPHAGRPYAIMEYAAPCYSNSSISFLLFPESLTTQNLLQSENHSSQATYTVSEPVDGVRSAIANPRVSFIGDLRFPTVTLEEHQALSTCYRKYHPDTFWLPAPPGNRQGHPFDSMWARLDLVDIYYVGGFGDVHYIGHIPVEEYQQAGEV